MTKKNKARLNVYIDPEIHEKVKEWSGKTGTSASHLINSMLKTFFNKLEREKKLTKFGEDYADSLIDFLSSNIELTEKDKKDMEELKKIVKKRITEELPKKLK